MLMDHKEVGKVAAASDNEEDGSLFPIGMRVLAIDANVVCLKYLVILLEKCHYKVTSTTEAGEAMKLLRSDEEKFDIVITDVVRLDMDGFKLLEIISLELDIPVIMVSGNEDQGNILKGIRHGARDYLLKPVRLQEMKNIWQHVVRKNLDILKKSKITKEVIEEPKQISTHQKVKEKTRREENDTKTSSDGVSTSRKKPRVNWSKELHIKFLNAVQQLGENEAVPNTILKVMNEPSLTRENIASHLQKYRNMLRKQNATTSSQTENNAVDSTTETYGYSVDQIKRLLVSNLPNEGDLFSKPKNTSSNYLMDLRPQMSNLVQNHQMQFPNSIGQIQTSMHMPVHGREDSGINPSSLWNYLPAPDFKLLKYPSYIPGFNLSGSTACNRYLPPHSCFNQNTQMLRSSAGEISSSSQQQPSVAWPFQSFHTPGKLQEVGNSVYLCGSGDYVNNRRLLISLDNVQSCNDLKENESFKMLQHSEPQFTMPESIFHHCNDTFIDDDLSKMVIKQFSYEGAPQL